MAEKTISKENLQHLVERLGFGITLLKYRYYNDPEEYPNTLKNLGKVKTALAIPLFLINPVINLIKTFSPNISENDINLIKEHKDIIKYCVDKTSMELKAVETIQNQTIKKQAFNRVILILTNIRDELKNNYETITEGDFKKLVEDKQREIPVVNGDSKQQSTQQLNSQEEQSSLKKTIIKSIVDAYIDSEENSIAFKNALKEHENDKMKNIFTNTDDQKIDELFIALKAQGCTDKESLIKEINKEESIVMRILKEIVNACYWAVTLGNKQTQHGYRKNVKGFVEKETEKQQNQQPVLENNL